MSDHKAEIYYYDIGDYLSREQKLDIITSFKSMENLPFTRLTPNTHGDWLSQRNDKFGTWIPLGDKADKNNKNTWFVSCYSNGVKTNRDNWIINYSQEQLKKNVNQTISFFNSESERYAKSDKTISVEDFIDDDEKKISWSRAFRHDIEKGKKYTHKESAYSVVHYRPYSKQMIYFDRELVNDMALLPKLYCDGNKENKVICVAGLGTTKGFTPLIVNVIPDLGLISACQCFPLYWYETIEPDQNSLFGDDDVQIVKHEAISDFILERAQSKYGNKVQREDIFYYVYGILHSKSYRETFEADLKKMLPRIPLVSDYEKFWAFSKAGRDLANLHLNYENIEAYPDTKVESVKQGIYKIPQDNYSFNDELMVADSEPNFSDDQNEYDYYAVQQMKFPKKGEKGTIIYNHYHTISNIPEKAYEYVVNGKSAIEWIMERYAITTDKKSGITNNPNDWSLEHKKPRYILDLLLSIINVSVQTVDIVNNLPEVDWDKE